MCAKYQDKTQLKSINIFYTILSPLFFIFHHILNKLSQFVQTSKSIKPTCIMYNNIYIYI